VADAQYIVDVAAQFSGEQTFAQMDALTSKLVAAGAQADTFQEAIVTLSRAQEAAAASASAANTALAAGNAEYAVLEQAANQAAKALERVAAGSKGAVSIDEYRAAALAAQQATAALDEQGRTLASLEQSAKQAAAGETALATSLKNVRTLSKETAVVQKAAADATKKAADDEAKALAKASSAAEAHDRALKKTAGALNSMGGPFGKLGAFVLNARDDFGDMAKTMGSANATALIAVTGIAAVATAVLAVTAVVIAGTIAITAWAIGLADSARNASLSQEAVSALHPEIAALSGVYATLGDETGQGTAALNGFVKQLKAAKVSAADMPAALRAAALAETALGQGGASEFVDRIKEGKVAVKALAAETQAKLGGIVGKQMMGIDAQSARLKKNIGQIFGGLNIEPVLGAMQTLVGLFDKNTVAGKALQEIFESVFQPIIDQAQNAAYVVEAFALGFLIGLSKVQLALKPAIKTISELFGFDDSSLAETLDIAKIAGEAVAYVFVGFIAVMAALGVAVAAAAVWVMAPIVAFGALVAAAVYAGSVIYDSTVGAFNSVVDFLGSLSLESIGTDLVHGLVNGIVNMGPNVLNAITGIADGAITAAKHLLGIASPSKVFAEIGGYTAEGFTQGIDDGAPDAQDAVSNLVATPSAAPASPGASGAGGSGGISIVVEAGAIVIQGVQGAAQAADSLRSALIETLEQYAAQATGAAS
jgi:hypothetical protein